MTDRRRPGHLVLTLAPGERSAHVPAHLDVLVGAARAGSRSTGGAIDRTSPPAAAPSGRRRCSTRGATSAGSAPVAGYNDLEEALGLSRTYRLELADPAGAEPRRARCASCRMVESVALERLATAPGVG